MRRRKISKTENKVKVNNCDVENLDHQNWQLLEGKSYNVYFNNQAKNLFKKMGRDRDSGVK